MENNFLSHFLLHQMDFYNCLLVLVLKHNTGSGIHRRENLLRVLHDKKWHLSSSSCCGDGDPLPVICDSWSLLSLRGVISLGFYSAGVCVMLVDVVLSYKCLQGLL
jgi:hypothetical protein